MSAHEFHSALVPPQGIWWKPAHRQEKTWIAIAFAWCLVLFAMMPLWHFRGGQNPAGIRYRVKPDDYVARVERFVADYKVGEESGIPIVAPPPGADVYLLGRMWQWYPALRLRMGETYRLHLSSLDLQHGFSLQPLNMNFQVLPGYDHVLTITPTSKGEFTIVCNEFCGAGHHAMTGKIFVE